MTAMRPYPIPINEPARSATVDAMALMERRNDPFFAAVTAMVRQIFGTPIAFISLFTEDEQKFLRIDGIDLPGTPREMSVCAFTVAARQTTVFADTLADPRMRSHPVVAAFGVRFAASAPVITSQGFCLGTVCGLDLQPRATPTEAQIEMLNQLAVMVARFYEQPIEPDHGQAMALRKIAADAQKEFLALVGHEMRTPLNGIHGMAQLLEARTDEEAEVVGAILSSAEHLNAVVGSVLKFTELSSGNLQLAEHPVPIDRLVERAMAPFRPLARVRGKTLTHEGPACDVVMMLDPPQMELALACLVSNAVMHGGDQIALSAQRLEDGSVVIEVQDNGHGIAPLRQARIWEAFGVGAKVHTRTADGIGLGLPLTRRIAELHGAELHLLHDADGLKAMLRLPHWRVVQG